MSFPNSAPAVLPLIEAAGKPDPPTPRPTAKTEPVENEAVTDVSGSDTKLAWEHVHATSPPELRRWLDNSKPVAMHQDALMVAVPNNFTRNQLEGRFRPDIEAQLSNYFQRSVQLAVIVDATITPEVPRPDPDGTNARLDGSLGVAAAGRALPPTGTEQARPPADYLTPSAPRAALTNSTALSFDDSYAPHPGVGQHPGAPPYQSATGMPSPLSSSEFDGASRPRKEIDAKLNPKYTFETFVIGSSNRFAHAAAVAVAENPGKSYNPLTIYGESGLGKTHLLHAIGRYARDYFERVRVRYVSTEELTNDFSNSISQNKGAEFRRRYRDVDVLLIDDIQFLEGKEQTQEEFFHTFNTLHNAQKQIVMTSDRPPKNLENLEPRLRSRFGWGLITDVQPPDLETRIAILRKKAAQERLVAGPDVLEFIASRIQTNIRELEGALIRVTAFASLNRQQVDLALAEVVLKDLIPEGGEAQITSGMIMAQTAAYFDLTIDDLCGQSRTHVLFTARQMAMYLCRELTDLSLPKIGQQFGGRDHTTVMHAERKIKNQMSERRSLYNQVTELTNRIKQQASQR